jgi:AraC-like DNA-binding protein/mannose-6-phosphate isomerase-like protein (cupin superfamily)
MTDKRLLLPEADYTGLIKSEEDGACYHIEGIGRQHPLAAELTQPLLDIGMGRAAMVKYLAWQSKVSYRHRRQSFVWVLDGHLTMTLNHVDYRLKAGDLLYFPPETLVLIGCPQKCWYIHINFDDLPLWQPLKENGIYVRPYEYVDHLYILFRNLIDAYKNRSVLSSEFALEDARTLAKLLKRELVIAAGKPDRHLANIRELVADIQEHPSRKQTLKGMANRLHVSISTLNRIFAKEYGISPMEMVIRERMLCAHHRIASTGDTIEAVALDLGYESISSFTRIFKRYIGKTPSECRQDSDLLTL